MVRLTDGQGLTADVSWHLWKKKYDPVLGKEVSEPEYYGLSYYIPDNMQQYLTYENVVVNGKTYRKIVMPPYLIDNITIGIRWKDTDVTTEITGFYTGLYGLQASNFSLNIYKADDLTKTPVSEILPNTRLNIDVKVPVDLANSAATTLGMVVPGVRDKVILYKVNDNGTIYYRNVSSTSNITDYQPFTATEFTRSPSLEPLPDMVHTAKAFFKTQDIKVLPPVIDRGSAVDAPINGDAGAYTRVVFDAAEGTVTASNTSKRVFDVLNTATWGEAVSTFGDLSVTAPSTKPVILGWTTPLPQNGESFATLAGSGTNTTVNNGSIKTITYTQAYSVEVTDQRPSDEANWYHVTFKAGDHGQFAGQQTTEYWVHKQATTKTLRDLTAPHVTPETDYFFTGWNQADTTQITGDLEISAINKPVYVSADPNDSNSYAVVTFDAGQHGSLATGASSQLWVLKAANKTFADLSKPQVNPSDGYEFTRFNPTNTGAIATDMTVTAEYRELDSHAHPAVIAPITVNKGDNLNPADFISNKATDTTTGNKLPADVQFAFVTADGSPATPSSATSGTQDIYVKVTYNDGSSKILATKLTVRTDAEKFVHDNGGNAFAGKGAVTVRKNKTVDLTQIAVNPALPQDVRFESLGTVSTATPTTQPLNTTGEVVFPDGSKLSLPVEVTVIDLDPSVVPSIVSPHKDGNLWTTDKSFVVSVPQTNGAKTPGDLKVTIGNTEVPADQIKDNGDGTYTISVPQGLSATDAVQVTFTEPDKNPGTASAVAPVVPASESNQPLLKAIEVKKNAELTPESIVANGPNSAADPKLPAGTIFEFIDANDAPTKADTSIPGTHTITLRVTYPDGSTDILTTTYTVLEPTSAEKYVERYTSAAGTLTIKRIENPANKLRDIALVQTDNDFADAHFTSIDTTDKDFTNPDQSPVATTGTLTFADGSELTNVPITVTVLELDPSVSPVISGVHHGDIWMRDAVFTVSIPTVNGVRPHGVLAVKVGGVDIPASDIVDNGDGTYTIHMSSDSAAVRPNDGNIEITFTEPDKNPTVVTAIALDKQPEQIKADPVKEEEQVIKIVAPSDDTDKIVVQLPDGTEIVLEKKDGQWPYMADPNGADAGKLLIPADMTPFTKGQIVKITAFDHGVASDSVDLVIDARPVDPKPQAPVVDDIKAGDTSIKVQIPEDAHFVEVVTKNGTILISKNAKGVWVDVHGNPVEVKNGKLIVPVKGLKAGDKIVVRTINRDGVVSDAVVKTILGKDKTLPRAGDTSWQGLLFSIGAGLSAIAANLSRSQSKRQK